MPKKVRITESEGWITVELDGVQIYAGQHLGVSALELILLQLDEFIDVEVVREE